MGAQDYNRLFEKLSKYDLSDRALEYLPRDRLVRLEALMREVSDKVPRLYDERSLADRHAIVRALIDSKIGGKECRSRAERRREADALLKQERSLKGTAKGLGFSRGRSPDSVSRARIVPGGRVDGNK